MKITYPVSIAFVLCLSASALAQSQRIDPAGIAGSVLLCGAGEVSDAAIERFIDLAGGAEAKILVLTGGDEKAEQFKVMMERLAASAKKKEAAKPRLVSLETGRAKAALGESTGVWLVENSSKSSTQLILVAADFQALLKRRGVVAIEGESAEAVRALRILPASMVDTRDIKKKKQLPTRQVGYEVADDATLLVTGRTLSAVGTGSTVITLAASKTLPARTIKLEGKAQADLTALRRAALDRMEGFPPAKVATPFVEKGTLVIVGGGGSPAGLYKQFVEYAGGPEKAKIVIFPTANPDPLPKREVVADLFRKAGAKKATVLYGQTRAEVESKEFLEALKEATGIWFDGGRQWRFVDCYENTKAMPLMFDVLKRGGVIGGTSAGATIQGEYLCRGGVFHNFDIRYEGYERGLGFLKGVAIDQHFSQRKRQSEMTSLMKTYPQYLGIGLDEATAIVVKGSTAEVIGKGKVHFYDAKRKFEEGQPDYEALSAGGRYDLKTRKVLTQEK